VQDLAQSALGRELRYREQPAAADRGAVPARPSRSHPADAGGCGPLDAARHVHALPYVRQQVVPRHWHWPPGIAAAEAIRAGDSGGKRAALLGLGLLVGLAGSGLKIPMSTFGVRLNRQCLGVDDVRHRLVGARVCDPIDMPTSG
jgi:hypothetical protein